MYKLALVVVMVLAMAIPALAGQNDNNNNNPDYIGSVWAVSHNSNVAGAAFCGVAGSYSTQQSGALAAVQGSTYVVETYTAGGTVSGALGFAGAAGHNYGTGFGVIQFNK